MTHTQAKIEAFEEAKRIMSRNMGDATYAEELAEFAVEDIDREIVRLKKAETRFPAAMTGSHAQAHIADDYKDFTGFGT